MSVPEVIHSQLRSLPIPPAALVIDMRGTGDNDDVIATLQMEIENLANELELQNVNHWRYLIDFLALTRIEPLTFDEVVNLRSEAEVQRKQQRSLAGRFNKGDYKNLPNDFYVDEEIDPSFLDSIPNDELRRNVEECIQLIDAVRNKRLEATGDVGKKGKIGPNTMNAKVQVIFLANEERPDTLSSASAYAAHLKHEYAKLEDQDQQVLDTMIICLNHDNRAVAPRQLMNRLQWKDMHDPTHKDNAWWHIDSLILSERYGANAARIPEEMQPYVAELLLYTLLITQPLIIRPAVPDVKGRFLPAPNVRIKEQRSLPPSTYLVGLAAVEHSARWGKRLLNNGLLLKSIQLLQDKLSDEKDIIRRNVEIWLSEWRELVQSAIPDKVAGDIPALQAFEYSERAAIPAEKVFSSNPLNLDVGQKTAAIIQQYADTIGRTYIISLTEREILRKEAQKTSEGQEISLPPTLQDALSTPAQIQQAMTKWQPGDMETPLIQAQIKAQRVLSERATEYPFYTGPQGAVPRAKEQLDTLSKTIFTFQNAHKKASVDLQKRREDLKVSRDKHIKDIQEYIQTFPFFGGFLHLKGFFAWLTLLFVAILSVIAISIGFAWLHHLIELALPELAQALDLPLLGVSFYTMIAWTVSLVVVAIVLFGIRRVILKKNRDALKTEIYFWLTLIAFPILGLIVSFSAGLYRSDPRSTSTLGWLSGLPFWSTIIFLIALLILVIEIVYYFVWHSRLAQRRLQIIMDIQAHRQETADIVRNRIANTLALELLRNTGLTDGNGGHGTYYHRIDQLYNELNDVSSKIGNNYRLAIRRLQTRANEPASTNMNTEKTPTLRIREEILDVNNLMLASKQLRDGLTNNHKALDEFAEILLRVMGYESPESINQQFIEIWSNDQSLNGSTFQENSDQHDAQVLLATTTAAALSVALTVPQLDIITPLKRSYADLDYQIREQLASLGALLNAIQTRISQLELTQQESVPGSVAITDTSSLSIQALTTWGQALWEYKAPNVEKLLASNGVMAQLQQDGYNPQTIKSLLGVRTVISGRAIKVGQKGELYLMMFPSQQGQRFFQDMRLDPHFVGIPDTERLLLLYIYQYVAMPHIIEQAENNTIEDVEELDEQEGSTIPPNTIIQEELEPDTMNGTSAP